MNTSPHLPETAQPSWTRQSRLPVALLVATLLTTDCTHSPKRQENPPSYPTEMDTSKPDLTERMTALRNLLEENMKNNLRFRSLKTLEAHIEKTLREQWVSPQNISVRLAPYRLENDAWGLVSISVVEQGETATVILSTPDKLQASTILSDCINDFEKSLQEETRQAFTKWLQECNGEIEVTELEQKIHAELENLKDMFIQHGFVYRWVQIGKNKDGEIVTVLFFDNQDGEHFSMEVRTGIYEKETRTPEKQQRSSHKNTPPMMA